MPALISALSPILKKIWTFVRKEAVLSAACLLAVVSCFLVPPDLEYFSYLDIRTLILLFCLMAVMAGLQETGLFSFAGKQLLKRVRHTRSLILVLVGLCFFSSMAITNDVALITFVPLGILVLKMADQQALICITVILQTLAANLGSMLTPMGNPQNLYLYTRSQLTPGGFLMVTLPCTLIAGILLLVSIFWAGRKKTPLAALQLTKTTLQPGKLTCYLVLFVCCLLAVFRILPVEWLLGIVLIYLLIRDRTLLKKVDYSLLLTFVAFFIFVGNMGRFPVFHDFMAQVVQGHERITAIAASQCISNVPAALLLSGFTQQWKELIIGTNIGGLGTLIASMASLISYKQIAQQFPEKKGRYLLRFTLWNLLFLGIFLLLNPVL